MPQACDLQSLQACATISPTFQGVTKHLFKISYIDYRITKFMLNYIFIIWIKLNES